MKRYFLTLLAAFGAVSLLSAQERTDSLALLRALEKQNYEALTSCAADLAVVAEKKVQRSDFFLWLGHLREGSWAEDRNWYPQETEILYLSQTGADSTLNIVWSRPLDSLWSRPEVICAGAVSPGSEIFPMLSPDGKRLYFASDGLFGMGGYDLYVAEWDPKKHVWGTVRNLGFPFNSKGDDLFFCDTPDGRYSLLVSDRDCGRDEVVIYVLRQETPVFHPIGREEVAARERHQTMAIRLRNSGSVLSPRLPSSSRKPPLNPSRPSRARRPKPRRLSARRTAKTAKRNPR